MLKHHDLIELATAGHYFLLLCEHPSKPQVSLRHPNCRQGMFGRYFASSICKFCCRTGLAELFSRKERTASGDRFSYLDSSISPGGLKSDCLCTNWGLAEIWGTYGVEVTLIKSRVCPLAVQSVLFHNSGTWPLTTGDMLCYSTYIHNAYKIQWENFVIADRNKSLMLVFNP